MDTRKCSDKILELFPRLFYRYRNWGVKSGGLLVTEHGLELLRHIPMGETVRLTWLAEHLGLTKGTVSVMVKKLVKAGLLERKRNPLNEREVKMRLTPKGETLLKNNQILDVKQLENRLRRLSANERAKIVESLGLLLGDTGLGQREAEIV